MGLLKNTLLAKQNWSVQELPLTINRNSTSNISVLKVF